MYDMSDLSNTNDRKIKTVKFLFLLSICWFVCVPSTGRKCQRKHGTKRLPSCTPARGPLTGATSLPLRCIGYFRPLAALYIFADCGINWYQ